MSLQREQLAVFPASDKNGANERKVGSLEHWIYDYEIDKFPTFKHLSGEMSGKHNKWGLKKLFSEVCSYEEEMSSSCN